MEGLPQEVREVIYQQGFNAYVKGQVARNPYSIFDRAYMQWEEGYLDAMVLAL